MRKLSLLALVLGLAACRGGDGDDGDDTPNPDSSVNGSDVTIQEIQNDAMVPGTPVNLKGVIVTAIDNYGMRTGDFWIQEPGGGEYSGVQVFGAPLDQVAALAVGDVVDISGAQKEEFALSSDMSGNTLTELEPLNGGQITVTKVSSGTAPAPQMVDALAIGQLADFMARHAEWEKWEGVPVTLTNVSALSSDECITSMGNCNDTTYSRFEITGDIQAQSGLAPLPSGGVDRGDCFASVTGIVTYFFDYQINPRTAAEFGTGGTGCPVENTMATCGDSIDNDGNGFTDCMDFSCQAAVASCSTATTVTAVQMGTATGAVTIDEVFVTARDTIGSNFQGLWVADALQGDEYNGVYVFTGSTMPDVTFAIGAKVKIQGTVTEFDVGGVNAVGDKVTQISNPTITLVAAPAGLPTPLTGIAITTLNDIGAAGEPYEGVLVQLSTLKVTNNALGFGKIELTDNNSNKIIMDDDAFVQNPAPAMNTCYSTVTGVMNVQTTDNVRTINPRSAADLVVGTGCN